MTERLVVYTKGVEDWCEVAVLDVLPRMRAVDVIRLIRTVAKDGDRVRYEGSLYGEIGASLKCVGAR